MAVVSEDVVAERLDGFHDEQLPEELWSHLLERGAHHVFLTREWLDSWRRLDQRGRLMIVLVSRRGRPVLLAPLYVDEGMVFFCGVGAADYLDFIGDTSDVTALCAALSCAAEETPNFVGIRLHQLLADSRTTAALPEVARRLRLDLVEEATIEAPYIDMATDARSSRPASERESLLRRERWFRRNGNLEIEHKRHTQPSPTELQHFFDQHTQQWAQRGTSSLFGDPRNRLFYQSLAAAGSQPGWLVFTSVRWNEVPIAFHFGFTGTGSFVWYKPSFNPDYSRRSPGEVLLRHLLLYAQSTGCRIFDFGIGAEAFKYRFATNSRNAVTWGLYPVPPAHCDEHFRG
jgi:CelD/BcsL family acetyltransferase involved in cellulose biosynthesis